MLKHLNKHVTLLSMAQIHTRSVNVNTASIQNALIFTSTTVLYITMKIELRVRRIVGVCWKQQVRELDNSKIIEANANCNRYTHSRKCYETQ